MSILTDLLKATRRDLRGGWLEECEDAITRAIGMAEALEQTLAQALAKKPRRFTHSDTTRLDKSIRRILEANPGERPTAKAVWQDLEAEGFEPMPSDGHVQDRLLVIRGKRKSGPNAVRTAFKPVLVESAPNECATLPNVKSGDA